MLLTSNVVFDLSMRGLKKRRKVKKRSVQTPLTVDCEATLLTSDGDFKVNTNKLNANTYDHMPTFH